MRKLLLLLGVMSVVAALAGTASAAPGTGGTVTAPPITTTTGFTPDPGVAVTIDRSKAPGSRSLIATPNVLCCDGGGGNVQGCATVHVGHGDGYGNSVTAYYHWCWLNGSISSNSGWADEAACAIVCNFQGWNYNGDFAYGHQAKATFRDVSVSIVVTLHYDTTASACVAVDGWGNSWSC